MREMPSIHPSTFRRRLRGLDIDDFVAFIEELWSARGYETHIDGNLCRVNRPDEPDTTERTFLLHHTTYIAGQFTLPWERAAGENRRATDPATVVTNASERSVRRSLDADIEVIDADDLYEIALYAIPRQRCREIFREYLDIEGPVRPPEYQWNRGTASEDTASSVAVWGLVALIAVILGAGVVHTGGLSAQPLIDTADGVGVNEGTLTSIPQPTTSPTVTATPTPTMLAPGVTEGGTLKVASLAKAHKLVITGRSYTWRLSYREYGPNRTVTLNETVRVVAPAIYRNDIHRNGTPRFVHPISQEEYYANDRFRFERTVDDNGTHYQRSAIDNYGYLLGRNANRAGKVIRRYLTVERSTIIGTELHNGRTIYIIEATGDQRIDILNATTVVWIDEDGFVYRLHRTHQPAGMDNVTVEFTFRYANLSNTEIDPPPWYNTALNRTE